MGCNTDIHGNNTRNLSVQLSLSQTSKNAMLFLLSFMFFSSTKLENKKAVQVPPGSWGGGGSPHNVYTCK
jgi:hypothetical protein